MSKGWLLLLGIVIWHIGAWAFAPPRRPPSIPQGDGRAFGSNEQYLVEAREMQRKTAITALDMPWGSRCNGDDRKRFLSGLNEYYYHRQNQTEVYPQTFGKAGADYIARQWSDSDDRRIDRLTQEAYAKGYLNPADFRGGAAKMIAAVVKNERVTGKGCEG
jgi:hypothetical protein